MIAVYFIFIAFWLAFMVLIIRLFIVKKRLNILLVSKYPTFRNNLKARDLDQKVVLQQMKTMGMLFMTFGSKKWSMAYCDAYVDLEKIKAQEDKELFSLTKSFIVLNGFLPKVFILGGSTILIGFLLDHYHPI